MSYFDLILKLYQFFSRDGLAIFWIILVRPYWIAYNYRTSDFERVRNYGTSYFSNFLFTTHRVNSKLF